MAVGGVLTLTGCSLGADEEPQRATGAPAEIAAVVQRLEHATAQRDWSTICADLFTAAARERAGGADCARLLREAAADVRRPEIEIRGIRVREEGRASVNVRTSAAGQRTVSDVLELRDENGEWRVEALKRLSQSRQPARASSVASKSVFVTPPMHGEVVPQSR